MKHKVVATLFAIVGAVCSQAEVVKDGVFTVDTYPGYSIVTDYSGGSAVVVPDQLAGQPVVGVDRNSFESATVTSVSLPGTTTVIGDEAFQNCRSLSSFTVRSRQVGGKTVSAQIGYLGDAAFQGCSALRVFTIQNAKINTTGPLRNYMYWGESVFSGCSSLSTIAFPSYVHAYPENLFTGCSVLRSVRVNGYVGDVKIGSQAFSGCGLLTSLSPSLQDKITYVGLRAFLNCRSLTLQNPVPDAPFLGEHQALSLENVDLEPQAFEGSGLTAVFLYNTYVPFSAFANCQSLEAVYTWGDLTQVYEGFASGAFTKCPSLTHCAIFENKSSTRDRIPAGTFQNTRTDFQLLVAPSAWAGLTSFNGYKVAKMTPVMTCSVSKVLMTNGDTVPYGAILVGKSRSKTLTVANEGLLDLEISEATISGAGFTISGLPKGTTITPGSSVSFTVTFTPTVKGDVERVLTIKSNSSVDKTFVLNLEGFGS